MGWLPTIRKQVSRDPVATERELHRVFEAEYDDLYWIAYVITGEAALAQRCVVDASGLADHRQGVFRDWLLSWSHYVTARTAALSLRDVVSGFVPRYLSETCQHADHETLAGQQRASLREMNPEEVIESLDPIARAVLVLRGCSRASIADCALLLQVPRKCVVASYCTALRWVSQRVNVREDSKLPMNSPWVFQYAEER